MRRQGFCGLESPDSLPQPSQPDPRPVWTSLIPGLSLPLSGLGYGNGCRCVCLWVFACPRVGVRERLLYLWDICIQQLLTATRKLIFRLHLQILNPEKKTITNIVCNITQWNYISSNLASHLPWRSIQCLFLWLLKNVAKNIFILQTKKSQWILQLMTFVSRFCISIFILLLTLVLLFSDKSSSLAVKSSLLAESSLRASLFLNTNRKVI